MIEYYKKRVCGQWHMYFKNPRNEREKTILEITKMKTLRPKDLEMLALSGLELKEVANPKEINKQ